MIARLFPAALRGDVTAPPSKSDAQRLLIAAWLAGDIDRVQLNGAQSARYRRLRALPACTQQS